MGRCRTRLPTRSPNPPGAVAPADFNGDGNLDLTITPNFGGDVAVLMGNGDATFQPAVFYIAPVGGPIEIADFDGDGKLDMVLSAGPPGGVDVFLGNGDGTFQPPLFYETGVGGSPVKGDFNGDGKLDVALSNPQLGVITALNTGKLSFSPSAPIAFPVQLVNTTSAPKTVALSNIGTVAISISSLTCTGNFLVSNSCGASIAAGASCNIDVTFAPKIPGNLHGLITLHDSASSKPQVILLSGQSTPLTLSPAQLNFGSQKVGTISRAQQVTVTNQGSTTVTFNFIDISGKEWKDFSINGETCSVQLAAGASCTVTITFSPTTTGSRQAFNYVTLVGIPYPTPVTLLGVGT